jgi:hypothetical protein
LPVRVFSVLERKETMDEDCGLQTEIEQSEPVIH